MSDPNRIILPPNFGDVFLEPDEDKEPTEIKTPVGKPLKALPPALTKNSLLDFLYRHVKKGCDNAEICKRLEAMKAPAIPDNQLNQVREFFRVAESVHPEKMKQFRVRLGLQ